MKRVKSRSSLRTPIVAVTSAPRPKGWIVPSSTGAHGSTLAAI